MENSGIDFFKIENHFKETEHIPSIPVFENHRKEVPMFTIAIPTYKRADYLKEALDSAINQATDIPYEIIVVDNNPERNDETELLMTEYNTIHGISYYKNGTNIGMVGNWNRLFTLAKTNWIIMLHDDDMLSPYFINAINDTITTISDADIIQTGKIKDKTQLSTAHNHYRISQIHLRNLKWYLKGGAPTGCALKKDTVFQLGGFNESFFPNPDYCFFSLAASQAKIMYVANKLTYYRWEINESQKIDVRRKMIINDILLQKSILEKLDSNNCVSQKMLSAMIAVRNDRARALDPEFELIDNKLYKLPKISCLWKFIYKIHMRFLLLID